MHSPERAALLHGIRWDRNTQNMVVERLKRVASRELLITIMDAVFKLEAGLAALPTVSEMHLNAARAHFRNALDDLCSLLEADEPPDPADVIDVEIKEG